MSKANPNFVRNSLLLENSTGIFTPSGIPGGGGGHKRQSTAFASGAFADNFGTPEVGSGA